MKIHMLPHAKRNKCGNRNKPVDLRSCCPGEPEETEGEPETADHGAVEAVVGIDAVLTEVQGGAVARLIKQFVDDNEGGYSEKTAGGDTEEWETLVWRGELVDVEEHHWDGGKEAEENEPGESTVDPERQDYGLRHQHVYWTQERKTHRILENCLGGTVGSSQTA